MAIEKFRGKYEFLSNMYPTILEVDGEVYPSAEHAFQAMKCLDKDGRIAMSACRSAKEAKKAGRLVDLRPDWEDVKVDMMYKVLKAKFSDPELAQKLRDTEGNTLVERNTQGDDFWGVNTKGQGRNMLGQLLMKVREEIELNNEEMGSYSKRNN